MDRQMGGALRQEHGDALGALDQRHQHGGAAERTLQAQIGIERMVAPDHQLVRPARRGGRRRRPAGGAPEAGFDGRTGQPDPRTAASGKNAPWLHTPNSWPPSPFGSASATNS